MSISGLHIYKEESSLKMYVGVFLRCSTPIISRHHHYFIRMVVIVGLALGRPQIVPKFHPRNKWGIMLTTKTQPKPNNITILIAIIAKGWVLF